jgi:deazaflavin-dependent oxidoreductase (nitroreductase family)
MEQAPESFRKPSAVERVFNHIFGILVSLGLGLQHNYALEVRGRKTGRIYSTPVNLIDVSGRRYLVCPRGRAQWVRNAEAAGGRVTFKRGSHRLDSRLRPLTAEEKPEILMAYLDRFKSVVQRYFPVAAGSPPDAFKPYLDRYPVFELENVTGG